MAVAKHLEILKQGVEAWNAWRADHVRIRPVLTGVRFEGNDFSEINFLKTNLSGSCLASANFRDADLRYADFSGCDLRYADFSDANLMLADLTGANLSGAKGVEPEMIFDAKTDETTVLP